METATTRRRRDPDSRNHSDDHIEEARSDSDDGDILTASSGSDADDFHTANSDSDINEVQTVRRHSNAKGKIQQASNDNDNDDDIPECQQRRRRQRPTSASPYGVNLLHAVISNDFGAGIQLQLGLWPSAMTDLLCQLCLADAVELRTPRYFGTDGKRACPASLG